MSNGIMARRPVFVQRTSVFDRRVWVYYYIIVDKVARQFGDVLEALPDDRFYDTLSKHVEAYLKEGETPPAAIAGAVMNAADDYLAGRDITLRAGDYIALQSFIRGAQAAQAT